MRCKISLLALLSAFAVSACGSDSPSGQPDASTPANAPDAAPAADAANTGDAALPDGGAPPCTRDQECASGEVCNVVTQLCVPGVACTTDIDCEDCSKIIGAPKDCKHGYHLNSYCGTTRGNVCTRGLAPCEECANDTECGELHPSIQNITEPQKCVDNGGNKKFCARDATSVGCPYGFQRDPLDGLCRRIEGCPDVVTACPAKTAAMSCSGEQSCQKTECPAVAGEPTSLCVNNDLPGNLGVCFPACTRDDQCTDPSFPVCNQRNGLCISGCTKDSCAGGMVCHADGFCAAPCVDDAACDTKFMAPGFYCNQAARHTEPRQYKDYRDPDSCAPLGCEQAVDCPAAGLVCDKTQAPPSCVMGCFTKDDCLSGSVCKTPGAGGPQPSYSRAECRGLMAKADDTQLGVCCNPGCTDRILQCDLMEFCCAEEDSPYADPNTCGQVIDAQSMMSRLADPGECFKISPKPVSPFCQVCDPMDPMAMPCTSDNYNGGGANWTYGYNEEPVGSPPFREQEFCFQVAMGLGMCGVSCNPNAADNGCPRGWQCDAYEPPCLQDADCNGLTCDGEDTTTMPPRYGRCQCGEMGMQIAACPQAYALLGEAVTLPRCGVASADGKMFCVASHMCMPPAVREQPPMSGMYNYPAACLP